MRKTAAPPKRSAGILLYRRGAGAIEVLLIHPGGPFWKNKDESAWSIPKGLYEPGEDGLAAAKREFKEETGAVPDGAFVYLGEFKLPSGKRLAVWAVEGNLDLATFRSETFRTEWPSHSGRFAASLTSRKQTARPGSRRGMRCAKSPRASGQSWKRSSHCSGTHQITRGADSRGRTRYTVPADKSKSTDYLYAL